MNRDKEINGKIPENILMGSPSELTKALASPEGFRERSNRFDSGILYKTGNITRKSNVTVVIFIMQ
jgi:hypothetical protein